MQGAKQGVKLLIKAVMAGTGLPKSEVKRFFDCLRDRSATPEDIAFEAKASASRHDKITTKAIESGLVNVGIAL
jgi:hypothetical protein